jgi:hypothetical protein
VLAQTKQHIGVRAVCARYDNVHPRTIDRWLKSGALPPPDLVNNHRRYWDVAKLDAHDRRNTIASADPREARATPTEHDKPYKQRAFVAAQKKGADLDLG